MNKTKKMEIDIVDIGQTRRFRFSWHFWRSSNYKPVEGETNKNFCFFNNFSCVWDNVRQYTKKAKKNAYKSLQLYIPNTNIQEGELTLCSSLLQIDFQQKKNHWTECNVIAHLSHCYIIKKCKRLILECLNFGAN